MNLIRLLTRKNALEQSRIETTPLDPIGDGEALLVIHKVALTTNNITYAAFGDAMQYWNFFPSDDPAQWGRVPVWGFATVVESNAAGLAEGERLYDYLPMADELVIEYVVW